MASLEVAEALCNIARIAIYLCAQEDKVVFPLLNGLGHIDFSPFVCGQYFPHYPVVCGVPTYCGYDADERGTCTKDAYNTRKNTHGVLVFMCAGFRNPLGFSLMDAGEGPL